MFVQVLNQVTAQTTKECQECKYVNDYLIHAISIWCNQLRLNQEIPGIADYILQGYQLYKISELTDHIYSQWLPKKEEQRDFWGRTETRINKSKLHDLSTIILDRINIKNEAMKIITIFAFFVTAIGYFIYKINRQEKQHSNLVENQTQYPFNPLNPPQPANQTINKYFLILVASASQADFLESLTAKRSIDINDAERLYKVTKYLWLGSESSFNRKKANLKNYLVTKKNSEYDIKLIYLELKQSEEGFKPNTNQLDRYDAFRKLPDLVVNFTISDRLQMEAYENFEVYNR